MEEKTDRAAPPPEAGADGGSHDVSDKPPGDGEPRKVSWRRLKIAAGIAAVAGMIVGSVVDRFVQDLLDSTGLFGPTLEQVVEAQLENFQAIQGKLDQLAQADSPADREELLQELRVLLAEQEGLAKRTHRELGEYSSELQALREAALEQKKVSGGADFYLQPGQSVSVAQRSNVLSLQRVNQGARAFVTLSGDSRWLSPGDFLEVTGIDGDFRVFNKGSSSTDPQRIGFDLVRHQTD